MFTVIKEYQKSSARTNTKLDFSHIFLIISVTSMTPLTFLLIMSTTANRNSKAFFKSVSLNPVALLIIMKMQKITAKNNFSEDLL
jgi:hypothetical protein